MCLASPFSGNDNRPAASRQKSAASRQKRGGQCCPPRGFSMKIRVVSYCFSRFIYCRAAVCVSGFSLVYTRFSIGPSISGHSRHDSPPGIMSLIHYCPVSLTFLTVKFHWTVMVSYPKKRRLVVEKNKKSAAVLHRLPAALICIILRHSQTRFYA